MLATTCASAPTPVRGPALDPRLRRRSPVASRRSTHVDLLQRPLHVPEPCRGHRSGEIAGNKITFRDARGPFRCKGAQTTGLYGWKLKGKKLTFTRSATVRRPQHRPRPHVHEDRVAHGRTATTSRAASRSSPAARAGSAPRRPSGCGRAARRSRSSTASRVEGYVSVTGDISASADVDAAVAEVERELGPIDILVNSAGVARRVAAHGRRHRRGVAARLRGQRERHLLHVPGGRSRG